MNVILTEYKYLCCKDPATMKKVLTVIFLIESYVVKILECYYFPLNYARKQVIILTKLADCTRP